MNIGQLDAPNPTVDTANPITQSLGRAIQRNLMMQERKKQSLQMPFVTPNAQQALIAAQLQNKYYGPQAEAAMQLQGAQSQNQLADAAKTRFMLANPGFMGGDASKELAGLIAMGLPVGNLQGGGGQQPQQGNSTFNVPQPQGGGRLTDAILAANANGTTFGAQGPNPTGANDSAGYTPATQMRQGDNNTPAPAPSSLANAIQGAQQPSPENQNLMNRAMPFTAAFPQMNPFVSTILDAKYANPAYQTQMLKAYDWSKTPEDAKNYMIAQAAGMGIDPSTAIEAFTNGKTVSQLAQEKGFDTNNLPSPDFLPTRGNIEKLKQRQGALAEINVLGDFVNNSLGKYSRTIGGYSPKQVMEAIGGMNEDEQANFLAARGLAPELANLRLNLAQGSVGQEALKEMMNKSMMNVNAFQALASPEVYQKAQKIMDDKLTQAFTQAETVYQVGNKNKDSGKEQSSQSAQAPDVKKGTVEDGYVFLGGDPADPKNWRKQ